MSLMEVSGQKNRTGLSAGGMGLAVSAVLVAIGSTLSACLSGKPEWANWMSVRWPFVVVGISIVLVVLLITTARLHAFVALVLAAIAAGIMTRVGALPARDLRRGELPPTHWIRAVELTASELGNTAAKVAIIIGLASVIGMCLMQSGAADKIVRRFLAAFGERRAGLALLLSTYIVSIPIFFDTIFMLLVPLAKALRLRTGRDYTLYMLAICLAGAITHSMVIPHPGPTAMAGLLGLSSGTTIAAGLLSGLVPLACGWLVCRWVNRRVDIPLVETPAAPLSQLKVLMDQPESQLPSLGAAITPIILPVALIWVGSLMPGPRQGLSQALISWARFLGDPNIALLIGTAVAMALLMRQRKLSLARLSELAGPPLETAGMIILITAAGGAFGGMLKNAQIGAAIESAAAGRNIDLILLGWLVAVVVRLAQGSATVAMMTAAGVMSSVLKGGLSLPYHPVYLFLAIGYGAVGISWMNDSGFWIVARAGGLTERQALRTWTVITGTISLTGLMGTVLFARLWPGI